MKSKPFNLTCDIEHKKRSISFELPNDSKLWDKFRIVKREEIGEDYIEYCFGGKSKFLLRSDFVNEMAKTNNFFMTLKNYFKGHRCFVIGNGPSLNKHDFSLIKNEFTIGSNYIFMNYKKMGFYPSILTMANYLVVEQRLEAILNVPCLKILPFYLIDIVPPSSNAFFLHITHTPEYSQDILRYATTFSTVTLLNLQIAQYLGFDEVYLIGVDNSYTQPSVPAGRVIHQEKLDPNHFSSDYFKGLKWQAADTVVMENSYRTAKKHFEAADQKIFNAGYGGSLEVFERVDYEKIFNKGTNRVNCVAFRDIRDINPNFSKVEQPVIISINPDMKSKFGHFFAMDDKLWRELSSRKINFVSLCNKKCDPNLIEKNSYLMPIFSDFSWDILRPGVASKFKLQLFNAIKILKISFGSDKKFILFMYCSSLAFAYYISEVVKSFSNIRLCLHLLWEAVSSKNDRYYNKYIAKFEATLFSSTPEFREYLRVNRGIATELLPLSSTTFTDNEIKNYYQALVKKETKYNILFPGMLQRKEKGTDIVFDFVNKFIKSDFNINANVILRYLPDFTTESKIKKCVNLIRNDVDVIEGIIDENDYINMLKKSHIIIIPYHVNSFKARPSGVCSDALFMGKPFIAARSTFMGNQIIRFGCGEVFEDQNTDSLIDAVITVLKNYTKYQQKVIIAKKTWITENSWEIFINRIVKPLQSHLTLNQSFDSTLVFGNFERDAHANFDETRFVYQMLSNRTSNSIMIDVGAHHGSSLLPFARQNWRIYAFEPDPVNRKNLIKNINGLSNVTVDSRAVSDKVMEGVPFYSSKESTGIGSLTPFQNTHKKTSVVDTTTLSIFCKEQNIKSVDFLKIDAEGYDFFVLKGFPWESIKPEVILCEFEDNKTISLGYNFHQMADFLMNKGYTLLVSEWHPIVRYGISHDWCRLIIYPCELLDQNAWGNLIAFKDKLDINKMREMALELVRVEKPDFVNFNKKEPVKKITIGLRLKNGLKKIYCRFSEYLIRKHPLLAKLGRFFMWSLRTLKLHFFGPGGLAILAVLLFSVAAYFNRDYRWLFASGSIGTMVFLLAGLGAGYMRFMLHRFISTKQNEIQRYLNQKIEHSKAEHKKLAAMIEQSEAEHKKLSARIEQSEAEHKKLSARMEQSEAEHKKNFQKANFLNANYYQPFNRNLRNEHIKRITEFWQPVLNLDIGPKTLGYMANRICNIENICSGRLATSLEDALLRVLIAYSIKQAEINLIEIGSLFGVNLAIFYDLCRGRFKDFHLTAIDPLEGYYEKDAYDLITNASVSKKNFEHNLKIMDIPNKDVTLIQSLSTDKEAIESAGKNSYNILIIDGDHSYNGVKFDFDIYYKFVAPKGYIIFDDYNSKEWPDVTKFVDNEIKTRAGIKFVGEDWRTVVFQVS